MENGNRLSGMIESFLFIAGDEGLSAKQLAILTECRSRAGDSGN